MTRERGVTVSGGVVFRRLAGFRVAVVLRDAHQVGAAAELTHGGRKRAISATLRSLLRVDIAGTGSYDSRVFLNGGLSSFGLDDGVRDFGPESLGGV